MNRKSEIIQTEKELQEIKNRNEENRNKINFLTKNLDKNNQEIDKLKNETITRSDLPTKLSELNNDIISNDFTNEYKIKVDGIENNANNYIHPQKHDVSMIEGISKIGKTGDYNDLVNKPIIPSINNTLTSDSNADGLSANQGKILNEKIGKINSSLEENKKQIDQKLPQIDFDNFRKDYVSNNGFAKTTGTSTIYNVILNPAPTSYVDGLNVTIIPHIDCGDNPTLNVNGLGVSTILKQDGSEIKAGEIKANKPLSLVRVGSNFFIKSSGGSGSTIKSISTYVQTLKAEKEKTFLVSKFDDKNSIVTVSSFSINSCLISAPVSVMAEIITPEVIKLTRKTPYWGIDNVEIKCVVRIITFENIKHITSKTLKIKCISGDNLIELPSDTNYDKCLVFHSQTEFNEFSGNNSGFSFLHEEFKDYSGKKNLNVRPIYRVDKDYYTDCNYQIVEFK